jgi:hypothetical protein
MRTLSNDTTSIQLDYPRTWNPADLTAVTIQISDVAGNELLADDAVEVAIYTETALDADSRRYTREIVLADESEVLDIGDLVRIKGILGYEDHVVKGYDAENLTAELEEYVDRDFEAGATVNRLSAIAPVDLSDTDVFPPGIQMVITWAPAGTGSVVTELAEIEAGLQIDVASFTKEFAALYPRAYNALKEPADRLDTVIRLVQDEMRGDLASRGLDISRIKDQKLINPPLMSMVALKWALGGDEDTSDELEVLEKVYSAAFEKLCRNPIWVDKNDDGIQNEGEVDSYPQYFERIW